MPPSNEEIRQLVECIWASVLGVEPKPPSRLSAPDPEGGLFVGSVGLSGDWSGRVALGLPEGLARSASAVMLEADEEKVSEEEMLDVVGELANMIGGNLKALIAGACRLSTPEASRHGGPGRPLGGSGLLREVSFRSNGLTFRVWLQEETGPAEGE